MNACEYCGLEVFDHDDPLIEVPCLRIRAVRLREAVEERNTARAELEALIKIVKQGHGLKMKHCTVKAQYGDCEICDYFDAMAPPLGE